MTKELCAQIAPTLALSFMLFSCKPPSAPHKLAPRPSGLATKEQTAASQEKAFQDALIESVADLKVELAEVVHGKAETRLFDSTMLHSNKLDESVSGFGGSSACLATRFNEFVPSGNPNQKFFEKFNLAGRESNEAPRFEVELLVRTVGSLSASRPELLQALLVKKSRSPYQQESDLVVYVSALEAVMENADVFRRTGYEGITSLQKSENPIYRLLATKLMPVLELNLDALADFYQPYVAENDETILLAAVDGLTTSGTQKALQTIQRIASNCRDKFPNVAKSADRAVELVTSRRRD